MRHALIAMATALASAVPAQAQVWEQVYPLQRMQTFTIEGEGVTVMVTPPPPYPEDREVSDEEHAATYAPTASPSASAGWRRTTPRPPC